jgi:hypothetical protein
MCGADQDASATHACTVAPGQRCVWSGTRHAAASVPAGARWRVVTGADDASVRFFASRRATGGAIHRTSDNRTMPLYTRMSGARAAGRRTRWRCCGAPGAPCRAGYICCAAPVSRHPETLPPRCWCSLRPHRAGTCRAVGHATSASCWAAGSSATRCAMPAAQHRTRSGVPRMATLMCSDHRHRIVCGDDPENSLFIGSCHHTQPPGAIIRAMLSLERWLRVGRWMVHHLMSVPPSRSPSAGRPGAEVVRTLQRRPLLIRQSHGNKRHTMSLPPVTAAGQRCSPARARRSRVAGWAATSVHCADRLWPTSFADISRHMCVLLLHYAWIRGLLPKSDQSRLLEDDDDKQDSHSWIRL